METLANAASAVSHAIFGDTTTQPSEEPVSGELGDTTKGEPYDAGNASYSTATDETNPETNNTSTTNGTAKPNTMELPTREKKEDTTNTMSPTDPTTSFDAPNNTTSTNPIQSEVKHDKTGVTNTTDPSSAFTSDKPSSSNEPTSTGPEPSISANPSSAVQPTPEHQGANRPEETPNSEETDHIKETKKEAEDAQNIDISGPGPMPLEEIAKGKVAGGSAGGSAKDDDDGPQKESHGEGTGEKYVKSTGMRVDGGDFDAANPGAGREADRLLEEKGIHHNTPADKATEDSSSGPTEDTAEPSGKKPSLKEKIKAKLHKH